MVIWSFDAKRHLLEIHNFIARDSKIYAQRVADEIVTRSLQLDNLPQRHHMMAELGTKRSGSFRFILIGLFLRSCPTMSPCWQLYINGVILGRRIFSGLNDQGV